MVVNNSCTILVKSIAIFNTNTQWLNYSKVGGGTLHFFPSLSFPALPQSFPFVSLPSPLEVGRPLPVVLALGKRCNLPQRVWGGAPAEID